MTRATHVNWSSRYFCGFHTRSGTRVNWVLRGAKTRYMRSWACVGLKSILKTYCGQSCGSATVIECRRPSSGRPPEPPEADWFLVQGAAQAHSKLDLMSNIPINRPSREPSRLRQNNRDLLAISSAISPDAALSTHVTLTAPKHSGVGRTRAHFHAHGDPPTFAKAINPDRKCPSQTASTPGRRLLLTMSTGTGCITSSPMARREPRPPSTLP